MQDLIEYLLSASFIGSILVYFCKRYLDKKTKIAEERRAEEMERKKQSRLLDLQMTEATWELFHQINRGIVKSDKLHDFWNGEYREAYAALESAYNKKKEFEQSIIAERRL